MKHQNGRVKLNMNSAHRRAVIRNQAISFIDNGHLVTTKARAQEVRRFVEKLVTIARSGNNFSNRRKVESIIPYKQESIEKLFIDIAPKYTQRPGGYTRIIPMGRRVSDTATVARLEWVA